MGSPRLTSDDSEVDETAPLLRERSVQSYTADGAPEDNRVTPASPSSKPGNSTEGKSVYGILSVLLIGVFVSQADALLVVATYGKVASEFHDLQAGSWLVSSYALATCVAQPLYGKLSDIFGRKAMLQVAHLFFTIGCAFTGLGGSMPQLIAARAIQGAGGAGLVALVSIIIADLVPLREVALYRGYVNIVQTLGRSCGGAIGGALAQWIGWRMTFLVQVPMTVIAMGLIAWKLHIPKSKELTEDEDEDAGLRSKLKRIDFVGAAFLSVATVSFLLILETGGTKIPWSSPLILIFACLGAVASALFVVAEKFWATEPIFPLEMLGNWEVVNSYALFGFQLASQMSLVFFIPLYFQITRNASTGEAGAYVIPSIAGNTVAGLLTGAYIRRTGRYKLPTVLSALSSALCFTLLLLFWHGDTHPAQSLFVFFAGFGTGVVGSTSFVAVSAGVGEKQMAVAASGLYLSANVGNLAGIAASNALFQNFLRHSLVNNLEGVENGQEIARRAVSDLEFVQKLLGKTRELVMNAYVSSFHKTWWMNLGLAGVCLILAILMRERRL